MMCQAGFGSLDVEAAKYTCFYDTFAGGYGGRAASDGPDAVQAHGQNTETHRSRRPSSTTPCASTGSRSSTTRRGRAGSAAA